MIENFRLSLSFNFTKVVALVLSLSEVEAIARAASVTGTSVSECFQTRFNAVERSFLTTSLYSKILIERCFTLICLPLSFKLLLYNFKAIKLSFGFKSYVSHFSLTS